MIYHFEQSQSDIQSQVISPISIKLIGLKLAPITTNGLWDTGSSHSGIASHLVSRFKLPKTRFTSVITAGSTDFNLDKEQNIKPEWNFDVFISDALLFRNITIHEAGELDPEEKIGLLIGMDIISKGNFTIEHLNKHSHLKFVVPMEFKAI